MKKILTTATIACLALCYSNVDAGQAISRAIIKRQVERGADINSKDKNGKTALIIFAEKGDLDMVKYLVKHGANDLRRALKIAQNKGYKEMADYLKISYSHPRDKNPGNEQVLQLLLARKNAIPMSNRQIEQTMNDPYKNGKPVGYELLQHVREGKENKINEFIKKWPTIGTNNTYATEVSTFALDTKVELIKYLLKNQINPNISGSYGKTALTFFAEEGDFGMVKYLVEKGANDIERALEIALKNEHDKISNYLQPLVKSILEQKKAIEKLYNDLAINTQTREVTDERLLVFAHALMVTFPKVNTCIKEVQKALFAAVRKEDLDILKYLIGNSINLEVRNEEKNTPLLSIFSPINNLEISKYLIDHGANVNAKDERGKTRLIIDAGNDNEENVKYLISHGADVNVKTAEGKTALHLAAAKAYENIVKYLVDHGADVNVKSNNGDTPLHHAAANASENIVKYLVDHGADVNVKDNNGQMALHLAAYWGRENIVKYLIDHKADINAQDKKYRRTPLHQAAARGRENIVKYLVEHGAKVNVKNNIGKTALDLASKNGHENIIKYLVEHGAITGAQIEINLYHDTTLDE